MTEDLVSLNYDRFDTHTTDMLDKLLSDKDFADVTLAAEDQQMKAHKFILSSSSSFFQNIFNQNPHQNPFIYLKGISIENLQNLVKFMYKGEVRIERDKLASFLEAGQELQIKFLKQDNKGDYSNQVSKIKENENVNASDSSNGMNIEQDLFLFDDNSEEVESKEDIKTFSSESKELALSNKLYDEDENFACNECDVVTSCKANLYRHRKLVHLKERFPCQLCDSILRRKDQLKQHQLSVHEGVRYSCDQCQFSAKYPQMVSSHKKKVHS